MSANNTDPDEKSLLHRVPLSGISDAVIFSGFVLIALSFFFFVRSNGHTCITSAKPQTSQSE